MSDRRRAGRATGSIVFLLLVISAAGGWNYHRNWQAEKATEAHRPYQRYAVSDLESLRDAYTSELAGVRANFDSAKRMRARAVQDLGSISGNVEQFEKTTRTSSSIRQATGLLAEREAQIEALEQELEIRSRFGSGFRRHFRLLITI